MNRLILVYHRVSSQSLDPWHLGVTPEHLNEQLAMLSRSVDLVRLSEIVAPDTSNGRLQVALTFDDGYVDNLRHAVPLLEAHRAPATVFVCTGPAERGDEFWWDTLERVLLWPSVLPATLDIDLGTTGGLHFELGSAANYSSSEFLSNLNWRAWEAPPTERHEAYCQLWQHLRRLDFEARSLVISALLRWAEGSVAANARHRALTREELQELAQSDLIDIGAHTVTHPALSSLMAHEQTAEIDLSAAWLSATVGRRILDFAYPFGQPEDYTHETVSLLRRLGFRSACVNTPGGVQSTTDRWRLPRIQVNDWDGIELAERLHQWRAGSFDD